MNTISNNLFYQLCLKVSNKHYFEQLMIKQQNFFDIHPYKIDKLYADSARKVYKEIIFKYQFTKQLSIQQNFWHQNQRKIFIWFIVCNFQQINCDDPFQTQINWNQLSNLFFKKSPSFLKFQFLNIIKIKKRILWSLQQDELLTKALQIQGIGRWNQISKALYFQSNGLIFKTPKHCRQRWLNHLDTNKNKGKWTQQEDYKIFSYVKQFGGKWSKIVQVLDNTRTQHMVKNRFNSLLTKFRKNKKQKQIQTIEKILKSIEKSLKNPQQKQQDIQNVQYIKEPQFQNQLISQQVVMRNSSLQQDIQGPQLQKSSTSLATACYQTKYQINDVIQFHYGAFSRLYEIQCQNMQNQHNNFSKYSTLKNNEFDQSSLFKQFQTSSDMNRNLDSKVQCKFKPVYIIKKNN